MANQSEAALGLKRLRETAGMTVRELADALGRPSSSYAFYEDKYRKAYLPMDLVRELVPILANKGVDPTELYVLAGVQRGGIAPPAPRAPRAPPPGTIEIPELDVRAMGGDGEIPDGEAELSSWRLPVELLAAQTSAAPGALRIIRISGDSMAPDFLPGERVLVDTEDRRPSPAGVFIVWDGFGLVIKRLEMIPYSNPPTVRLLSRNSAYTTYERPLADVTINGRVIAKWLWT